jgi:hypothetical protein
VPQLRWGYGRSPIVIINSASKFSASDVSRYAWDHLALFLNVRYVTDYIVQIHELPKTHRDNARRQAQQIRYCLIQAQEYFNASVNASMATRPALLYYCAMSLALSEVLLKQSGDSRLERLREQHNGHGLVMSVVGSLKPTDTLRQAASSLLAKQQVSDGRHWGTFEVWKRSSRETPLCGELTTYLDGMMQTTTGYRALMMGRDVPPPPLNAHGISLMDCFRRRPGMATRLAQLSEGIELVRAKASGELRNKNVAQLQLTVQPGNQEMIDRFAECIVCYPHAVNSSMNQLVFPSGFILTADISNGVEQLVEMPFSIVTDTQTVYFSCTRESLNEFGIMYVALHICGNLARYFPDKWLLHIDERSSLCLAVETLLQVCTERLPLMALSELTRSLYVPEA